VQLKKGERSYLSSIAAKLLWDKHGKILYIYKKRHQQI
jgi:hypothetical protein